MEWLDEWWDMLCAALLLALMLSLLMRRTLAEQREQRRLNRHKQELWLDWRAKSGEGDEPNEDNVERRRQQRD